MGRLEKIIRKLFGFCEHKWEFKEMIHVNKYDEEEDYSRIVSSKEYSMQKCTECNQVKFRKL